MRVLMIGAHQDDCEFRCSGLASKLVKKGHTVKFLSMCDGSGGHHILTPEETTATRAKESAAVAKLLGITYDVWDVTDCNLVADLPTRKRLIRYIREFDPDIVIAHRTNDYHADHRASAQLVQDATYLLTVPHECPDAPAMRFMPVVLYNADGFQNPPFKADLMIDVDSEIDIKLRCADLNACQVYEWLPYTHGETVPEGKEERFEWLKGMHITADTTDEEVLAAKRGYMVRFARVAAKYRKELMEQYGVERGSKVRFAEAFEFSEYGKKTSEEMKQELLNL